MPIDEFIHAAMQELEARGVSLSAWAIAWARVLPTAVLLPVFGLRALPIPARVLLGGLLVLVVSPALVSLVGEPPVSAALLVVEVVKGLPVALTAAAGLWAATMAGGIMDSLRAGRLSGGWGVVDDDASAVGTLLTLIVAVVFLDSGGASQIARLLADVDLTYEQPLIAAVESVAVGIHLAIVVAAPIAVTAILFDVVTGIATRTAVPVSLGSLVAPIRAIVLLAATAIFLRSAAELLSEWTLSRLPNL